MRALIALSNADFTDHKGALLAVSDPFEQLQSAREIRSDVVGKTDKEKGAMYFVIDLIAHRVGVFVLGLLSGVRLKGESGFAWGWAVVVGD
ncbi:hypothetical protein [Pseudomonas moraviensis]|uniref:hypothetical protein n=1 Tax=Pseudomonas moraviensis TaxID=321662 RepID=UPI00223B99D5|nr:hypothetical protein [Pseudomonas moraviensis]